MRKSVRNTKSAGLRVAGAGNLRRDADRPEIWRRAGMPRAIATSDALPLAEVAPGGGTEKAVILAAGRALYVAFDPQGTPAGPLEAKRFYLGMLGGEPLEAETSVAGLVKIHCRRSAPEYVTYSSAGEFVLRGPLPELPPIAVRADQARVHYADTPAIRLSGATNGRDDSSIAGYDLPVITDRLLLAYSGLKLGVKNAGAAMQPVLARYRLRDSFGATVFLSSPVLLCAPSGFQAAVPFSFSSSDSMGSLLPGFIQCDSYHLAVNAPEPLPAPWDSIVASAEIEVSPQLDPVDAEGVCEGSVRLTGAANASASVCLPGIQPVLSARQAAARSLVADALARAESLLEPVAKIGRPFGGTLGAPGTDKYISMRRGYISAAGLASRPVTKTFVHGTTHTARLSLDGLSLRANPSTPLPKPTGVPALAAVLADAEGDWKGAVAVTLRRGDFPETLVTRTDASRACPVSLGPLLVYPDPDATELSVSMLRPDGSAVARTFPLTPIPEAGVAYWIDPAIARVALPKAPFGFEVPLESFNGSPAVNGVDVFVGEADTPAGSASFDAEVVAMADAPRSRSSWDFSRRRVLCFGSGGTEVLTIGADGVVRSRTLADRRPVLSPDAVARAGGKDGASVLAVAGDDLIRVSGTRIETLLPRCRAARPGWCARFDEIWLFGGDLGPRRLTADGEIIDACLPGISSDARCALWRGRLLIGSGGRLYDAATEDAPAALPFSLSFETAVGARPRALRADLAAGEIDGTISVEGHDGSEIFGPLAAFIAKGQVNRAMRFPLIAPSRRFLRLSVAGTASPDLRVNGLSLEI